MGWFDEDSDDDDEAAKTRKPLVLLDLDSDPLSSSVHPGTGSPGEKESTENEEEDPLDAYMKTLNKVPAGTTTDEGPDSSLKAATTKRKASRLDLDNEEEATSHWQEPISTGNTQHHSSNEHNVEQDNNNELDQDGYVKRSTVAKRALQQTFRKAGSDGTLASRYGDSDSDDGDDAMHALRSNKHHGKASKEMDIQLDQVDHKHMKYNPFEKVFWKPPPQKISNNSDYAWRRQHGIAIHGAAGSSFPEEDTSIMPPIYDFAVLKEVLDETLLQRITKLGYHHPTPVQAQTLPVALNGCDALITAPTGSGKTLAYVWPMVVHVCAQHHLAEHETGPIGLILVPTRELAQQVQKHVQAMLAPLGGSSLTIIGGMGKYPLTQHLRQKGGVEIVVATPGRLLDVVATKQQQQSVAASQNPSKKLSGLSLERVTMVVLDESDRLLHMGFANQVTQILQNIRPDRQTLMLSATMSHRIENVAKQWLGTGADDEKRGVGKQHDKQASEYVRIAVGRTGQTSLHVQQHVMVVPSIAAKLDWLQQMLPVLCQVGRTLVFCATKEGCEQLAKDLKLPENIHCVTLHGDKHQSDRNAALRKFVKQQQVVLIATDVASRGLDIPKVTTVLNYDPPKSLDIHVHRVGRAGRLSASKNSTASEDEQQPNEGSAYTLLRTPKDADIGAVLLGAMEREHRPVSEDLRQLAKLSRQHRGSAGSTSSDNYRNTPGPIISTSGRQDHVSIGRGYEYPRDGNEANEQGYYGPSSQPAGKKGRWS